MAENSIGVDWRYIEIIPTRPIWLNLVIAILYQAIIVNTNRSEQIQVYGRYHFSQYIVKPIRYSVKE
jgi:hypothetical protein